MWKRGRRRRVSPVSALANGLDGNATEVPPCVHNPAATFPPCQLCYPADLTAPTPISKSDLFEQWQAEFKPLLGDTARWDGFCYILRDQLSREHPCILETGTLRNAGNWHGDGQSTRIWDWIAKRKKGFVVSVDKDSAACFLAQMECQDSHIVCQDSIALFRGFLPVAPTLLYLDSIEWGATRETNISCWMNQVGELAAVWDKLPSGCLIASDDSQSPDIGKPVLTRRLFEALAIAPEHDSYIVCWRKP